MWYVIDLFLKLKYELTIKVQTKTYINHTVTNTKKILYLLL